MAYDRWVVKVRYIGQCFGTPLIYPVFGSRGGLNCAEFASPRLFELSQYERCSSRPPA